MSNLFLTATNPFIGFTNQWIINYINHTTELIHQHSPKFIPPLNKKTGQRQKPLLMPWMLPTWNKGLEMAKHELERRKES
jgi:hypothetical protein